MVPTVSLLSVTEEKLTGESDAPLEAAPKTREGLRLHSRSISSLSTACT